MTTASARLAAVAALLAAAALPAQPPSAGTPAAPQVLEQRVDSIMRAALALPIEGVSVAVMRGDRVVLERAYGVADRERGLAAAPGVAFEIGSITKQVTAAAIVRLAEAGRLGLDDPIGAHLPALAERAPGVTLRHLLSHTSGLSRAWAVADLTAPSSPQVVVDSLAVRAPESAPGARYAYNNNGYILLGLVIERVTGAPWARHVRDAILAPIGLAAIAPCDEVPAERRAAGYVHATRGPATAERAPSHHATVTYAAGQLCATAADVARWQHALASGRVVSEAGWRAMTTAPTLASGRPSRYGLGVELGTIGGLGYLAHSGATPGFLVEGGRVPEAELGVVVLTNGVYAGSLVSQLAHAVARAALDLPQPAVARLPLDAAERARFAGTFALGEMPIEVYEQGEHLRAAPKGQLAGRLLHQGDGVFVAEHDPGLRFRFRVVDGRAEELVIEQGGRAMPPARRTP